MNNLGFLLQKEFRQIFRDRTILAMILVMPLVQLLVLPLAADYDIKKINLALIDQDHSPLSRELVSSIFSSGYFVPVGGSGNYRQALQKIERAEADIILEIPPHFERSIGRGLPQDLLVAADAINGTRAGLGTGYLTAIISRFNGSTRLIRLQAAAPAMPAATTTFETPATLTTGESFQITSQVWFNPHMNYRFFMVPGILVILVTMIAGYMSALNIVREKEIGTIEQINVSPIRKYEFLLGKLIPFWLLGILVFSIGLLLARLVYGIIPAGNIGVLYLFLSVYLVAILGFGLLVSTYCENQLQSMFIAFFFIMIFILMSGLFTPIESMPEWAQWISRGTPVSYFIEVMRLIVLKGSGLRDILPQLAAVAFFALFLNGWALLNYHKTR